MYDYNSCAVTFCRQWNKDLFLLLLFVVGCVEKMDLRLSVPKKCTHTKMTQKRSQQKGEQAATRGFNTCDNRHIDIADDRFKDQLFPGFTS